MKVFQVLSILALTMLSASVCTSVSAAEKSPEAVVKEPVDQVIQLLKHRKSKRAFSHKERVSIRSVMEKSFDARSMAAFSLGVQWYELKQAERKRFTLAFVDYLDRTYLGILRMYSDQQLVYGKTTVRKNRAFVPATLVSGRGVILIGFHLRHAKKRWLVDDVSISGGSMAWFFYQEFEPRLKKDGYKKLLNWMEESNRRHR